jgi:endonuclease G, mitochondrial
MSAPPDELAFDVDLAIEAAGRWEDRRPKREQNKKGAEEGKWTEVEDRGRLAKVANRRIRQLKQAAVAVSDLPQPVMDLVQHGEVQAEDVDDEFMERVIGATRDFLGISFFEAGLAASRAVCRIISKLPNGKRSFGSGFMVTPRLLITNHHVLKARTWRGRASQSSTSSSMPGRKSQPVYRFELKPDIFFLNDKPNDFALVAVEERTESGTLLASFGLCPLIGAEGKIANTEWVNIVQHPKGDLKQVVIRENRLIDLPDKQAAGAFDRFAYYEADTEPGSSGSPVFNDLWEVIALHHSSVPKRDQAGNILDKNGKVWQRGDDPTRIEWVGNEGIRVSRIVNKIAESVVPAAQKKLHDEFMQIARSDVTPPAQLRTKETTSSRSRQSNKGDRAMAAPEDDRGAQAPISITVNVSVGADGTRQASVEAAGVPLLRQSGSRAQPVDAGELDAEEAAKKKKKKADPDVMIVEKPYDNRKGFDAKFLGVSVPLPKLGAKIKKAAVKVGGGYELKYHHYSVIMNGQRKTAFVSAVNIDLQAPFKVTGERSDKWYFDDRIKEEFQAGNDAYANEVTDRGHLTRRADSAWGKTQHEANKANADTFHWTNCSIQHEAFNRSTLSEAQDEFLWGSIEVHIAKEATAIKKRLSVFNGPIMKKNDRLHRGILVPKEFFKIVVCKGDDGKMQAFAFKLSQSHLIEDLPEEIFVERDFEPGEKFEAFQVLVADIEKLTGLDFGKVRSFDMLAENADELFTEGEEAAMPLTSLDDIVVRRG